MKNLGDIIWRNCCRTKSCPEIGCEKGSVYIKDDDGLVVKIKIHQIEDLIYGLRKAAKTDSE